MLMQIFRFLIYLAGTFGFHIDDSRITGDYDLCVDFKRPTYDILGTAFGIITGTLHTAPPSKIQVLRGFRGERVPLRCQHTRRHSQYYWFISDNVPDGSRPLIQNLVPLPRSSCFQRKYYGYSALGVEVLTVLAQQGTVGWFTCIENINQTQFYQREIFLLLLVQPANVSLQVDLVGRSSINCEIAREKLSDRHVPFDRKGVTITFEAGKAECKDETITWHCLKFIGEFKGPEWKHKNLTISDSGFIPTGPLGPFNRLKFENVLIGFSIDFVRTNGSKVTTLGSLEMTSSDLCVEANDAGPKFDWMILDAYMGYAELAGGFRIPIRLGTSFGDLDMIDGVQIASRDRKSIGSAVLQQAIFPETVMDRLFTSSSKDSESTNRHQKPDPCGAPISASNRGYLITTYTQLCPLHPSVITVFVTDAVSQIQRKSTRLIFVEVDAVVGTGKSRDHMMVVRLIGRSLSDGSSVKASNLMTVTWDADKLHFNPSDGKRNNEDLGNPGGKSNKVIGGRLTMTIGDEGTVVNFTFTLGSSGKSKVAKRLLLSTPIDNGLEVTVEVPQSRACDMCYLTVIVDRRSVTSIPRKWSMKNQNPQSVLPPINYGVSPVKKATGSESSFIAYRSFTLRWSEANFNDSSEDLRNWFARMQSLVTPNDVTVIYKNSWPVCPMGQHLAIPNPPHCVPCQPGTYGAVYKAVGKAKYEAAIESVPWDEPYATVCVACPKGAYQTEPGKTNCTKCSENYNALYCQRFVSKPKRVTSRLVKKHSTHQAFNITESKSHLRQTFTAGVFGIFFLCLSLLGLLAGVIYFFLEAIGFMLVAIAKATHSARLAAAKRATRICKKEIARLRKLHPDIDLKKLAREELCITEIQELQENYPEIDWGNLICDSQICWLQKCYPYIRWSKMLLEELPKTIRSNYPYIDWEHIIEEYICQQEIEETKMANPEINWSPILSEARIEHLRRNIPYLNWDGIVCEERLRRLREAHPDIDFDNIVSNAICESEINKLRAQYPGINWEEILCEERALWLRARYPMVNWDNIVCEVRVAKLKCLYPEINWENAIQDHLCEQEIEDIKRRFHCLDWESILRGGDIYSIRMTKYEAINCLTSRFPDVAWNLIISEHLSDYSIGKLRKLYPYLDWDAITTAIFHPLSIKSVNFKSPEVCQKFRSFVPSLEQLYPFVDWRYFVEKKYASPYVNWDYLLKETAQIPYFPNCILKPLTIERLNDTYPHVNWNAFCSVGVDMMFKDHPYIHWKVILDPEDICGKEVTEVEKNASLSEETVPTIEQEGRESEALLNEDDYLLREYRMRRSTQLGDYSLSLDGANPRTSMAISAEIAGLKNLRQDPNWSSIVDHELRSRRRDESHL